MNKKYLYLIGTVILITLAVLFVINGKEKPQSLPPSTPPLDEVKVQLSWYPGAENAFMFYGIENGIFDSLRIKIDWKPSKGSSIVATGLANNEFNIGFISSDYVIVSKSKGFPIKAIIALYHETPVTIFSLKGENIVSINDLKGKRLGVLVKSSTYPQVLSFLKINGLEKDRDFTEVLCSGTLVELTNDKVDAMMHYSNYGPAEMIGKNKREINEIKLKDNGIYMYGTCIAVNEDFAKRKSDVVERFAKGCLISLQRAKNNHNKALSALLKNSPNSDSLEFSLALKITEDMIYDSLSNKLGLGYMTTEGWQQTYNQVQILNNEKYNVPIEDLFTTKFLK